MVIMGAKGETMVEVRLFDSARFYKTSSSAWSQEDLVMEPQVDDREWAGWDDEEWASSEDEDGSSTHTSLVLVKRHHRPLILHHSLGLSHSKPRSMNILEI